MKIKTVVRSRAILSANTYYPAMPVLQQLFADKDTGSLLVAGIVTFYKDSDRTTKKDIYTITGMPGEYTYVPVANPQTLDLDGSFSEQLFLYPYDDEGNPESYYITVENSNGVPQRDFQNVPEVDSISVQGEVVSNFVLDGQFAAPGPTRTLQFPINYVSEQVSVLRTAGSTATDSVSFSRIQYAPFPEPNLYNQFNLACTVPDVTDTVKTIRLKFPNVNLFASGTDPITFALNLISNSGSALNGSQLFLIKNFGTGGSTEESTPITDISFDTTWTEIVASFPVGDNSGKTVGPDNDDFIAFDIRLPATIVFDVSLTGYLVAQGEVLDPAFQQSDVSIAWNRLKIGDFKLGSRTNYDPSWKAAQGQAVSRVTYGEYFSLSTMETEGTTTADLPIVLSGSTVTGSPLVSGLSQTKSLYIGMTFTMTGFTGTGTIVSVDSDTQITADTNATATATNNATFLSNRTVTVASTAGMFVGMQTTSTLFTGIVTIMSVDSGTQLTVNLTPDTYGTDDAVLFYFFGAGNGTTTFNLPNMGGRFPIGTDAAQDYREAQIGGIGGVIIPLSSLTPHEHTGDWGYQGPNNTQSGLGLPPPRGGTVNTGTTGEGLPLQVIPPYTTINYYVRVL